MKNMVLEKLNEHYNYVTNKYGEDRVIGVFLYGSQNYQCDTEFSDVDSKAIICPPIKDYIFEKRVSIEHTFESGEHCEIKDIREMVKMWEKQNINFLEILWTPYYLINYPLYGEVWTTCFKMHREEIARYNPIKAIRSICGQSLNTVRRGMNNPKAIANGWRYKNFLEKYKAGTPYGNCLIPDEDIRQKVIEYKKLKEDDIDLFNEATTLLHYFEDTLNNTPPVPQNIDPWIKELLLRFLPDYKEVGPW